MPARNTDVIILENKLYKKVVDTVFYNFHFSKTYEF